MQNDVSIVRRLSWAGVEIAIGNSVLVIDAFENTDTVFAIGGAPRSPVVPCPQNIDVALVTHLHRDHYDPDMLKDKLKPGAPVFATETNAVEIAKAGLNAKPIKLYESHTVGPYTFTAVPAVDGIGDSQVSFVVEFNGKKLLHCGDTLWHGYWWKIAERFGPFDVVFLPVNGVLVEFPGMKPSGNPVALTPPQAASAAALLGAKIACPIHYGMFENPPVYVEVPQAAEKFVEHAASLGVSAKILEAGETLGL